MPKIDAPTVAEHHRRRHAALLAAAEQLLVTGGLDSLTLAAVGASAGLARTSVYQYFDSVPALLADLFESVTPRAIARIEAAADDAVTSREKVDAVMRTLIEVIVDPLHQVLSTVRPADLPPPVAERLLELHRQTYAPLGLAVRGMRVAEPELVTMLLLGLASAAGRAVMRGHDLARAQDAAVALALGGIGRRHA